MEHVDGPGKFHGVHHAVCAAVVVLDDLEHSGSAKALQDLGTRVLPPRLSLPEGESRRLPDTRRKRLQILPARPHPEERLFGVRGVGTHTYAIFGIAWQVCPEKWGRWVGDMKHSDECPTGIV